jgi:hypothetical protein
LFSSSDCHVHKPIVSQDESQGFFRQNSARFCRYTRAFQGSPTTLNGTRRT